jgi:hypothetical protein
MRMGADIVYQGALAECLRCHAIWAQVTHVLSQLITYLISKRESMAVVKVVQAIHPGGFAFPLLLNA